MVKLLHVRPLVMVLLLAATARAGEPFRYDWGADSAVTVIGLWAWLSSDVAQRELEPTSCRWCERDASGRPTLNGFDSGARDALRWAHPSTAETLSNALGFAVTPLMMLGSGLLAAGINHQLKQYPVDLLLFAESAVVAADLNQAVKLAVGRERPFVHFADSAEAQHAIAKGDAITSFYSGHTTLVFAMATSAGTIASMRRYRLAPLVWVLGMTLAATTGYLRIAADRHYLSDVLVGGAAGSLVGFVNPFFVHRKRVRPVLKSVAEGGAVVGIAGNW